MSFVLDNSVALAWCFEDEQSPAVMALLDRVTETGAVAPLLWPLEALNGLLVAERRRRLNAATRAALTAFLRELPIMLDLDTAERAWGEAAQLAERFRLSVYDATYLELALRRRLPLASLDQGLREAAGAMGVDVLGVAR
ncbi:MAG: type II toxin-antitoxin system VapC family toxin [Roseomonas sp.]|nr:type II toxin-antitoxin system VapC family toxin [Roseomonas sp.]